MTSFSLASWRRFGIWLLTHCYCHYLHVRVTNQRLCHICHCTLLNCQSRLFEKWAVICKGHVNPLSHEGALDECFCLKWGFLGATWDVTVSRTDSRWHCARPQSPPEVLYGPAAFWTYYLKVFLISCILSLLCSFLARCNWICKVRYLPLGPIHLRVLWSFCHSVSHHVVFPFFLSLPPLRQTASTQVSHQQSPLIWLTSLSQWGH